MLKTIASLLRLGRVETSALLWGVVFIPVLTNSNQLVLSLKTSLPMLLISMCTFILNDIGDVEKDRINHPDRPIPNGEITLQLATFSYFILILSTITYIYFIIPSNIIFIYFAMMVLCISYNYIVEYFPYVKNFYVAGVMILPLWVVDEVTNGISDFKVITFSIFLTVFGREVIMDVLDEIGDKNTLAKIFGSYVSSITAFLFQLLGIIMLYYASDNIYKILSVLTILSIYLYNVYCWTKIHNRNMSIRLMKVQLLAGYIFLL